MSTREPSKVLSRNREVEVAESIQAALGEQAKAIAGSAAGRSALGELLERAKRGPDEASALFLGLGDDWGATERGLDELQTALQHARSRDNSASRNALVTALLRTRLSRQGIDLLLRELDSWPSSHGRGRSAVTTASTLRRCRQIYESAKTELVRSNMGLVFTMASKRSHPGLSLHDLVQEGTIGLMHAVDRFDHRRGIRLATYAGWWIRHAMNRALSDYARTIRLPVHLIDTRFKVRRAARQFAQESGREPTEAELAERSGLPQAVVGKLASVPREPMSLDAPLRHDGESRLADVIPDRVGESPIEAISSRQAQLRLRRLLKKLTPREQEVIRLRFGIDRGEPLQLAEVGRKFALSRERIRQIEAEALDKLLLHASREQLHALLTS
jgi:RNA polymerase primary sigma factor